MAPPPDTTTTNHWLVASYATLIALWGLSQVVYVPYVAHLMVLVTSILYAACHASLGTPDGSEPPKDASRHSSPSDREVLRAEDAYQFPLMGSISLFGLFLSFRYLDKDLVNLVIGVYFALVGCFAVTMTVDPLVRRILFFSNPAKNKEMQWSYVLKHPLPAWLGGESPWDVTLKFTISQVVAVVLSATICTFYIQSRPWYLNNVLGMCFCLQGIEQLSLGTFKIGAILLIGLFFYDIFWVRSYVCVSVCPVRAVLSFGQSKHSMYTLSSYTLRVMLHRSLERRSWSQSPETSTALLKFSFLAIPWISTRRRATWISACWDWVILSFRDSF
jgi:hypothetical protein